MEEPDIYVAAARCLSKRLPSPPLRPMPVMPIPCRCQRHQRACVRASHLQPSNPNTPMNK
eukprot:3140377-Pyramimonas_sp.AAC.2